MHGYIVPPEYAQNEVKTMVEKSLGFSVFPSYWFGAFPEIILGRPLTEVFSHFEDTPLGSASIGQVFN